MSRAARALRPHDFGIGQLFWRIHEAVIVGDAGSGRIVLWNPAAEAIFGYSAHEAVGRRIEILIPEDLRAAHRAGLARFAATGHGAAIEADAALELPAVHKSGRALTIELTLSALEEGPIDGRFVLAIIRDATARKLAEEQRVQLAAERAARAKAEEAQGRLRFLSAAGAILASSLEYETTLDSVARLAVPVLADWAFVEMLQADGSIERLAIAHRDPEKEALAKEYDRRYPLDPDGPEGSPKVIRTGRPELIPEIPDALLQAIARDAEHLRILRELGFRSLMIVPLVARGRILGDLTFATDRPGRRYGPDDLALAEELAHRAALAVDNARLYREAREALRGRDEFLSIAAHELKTPMTSLLGFSQLLASRLDADGGLPPRLARPALEAIGRQVMKLSRLVAHLLDVSRMQSGQLRLERADTDLGRLVEGAVHDARTRTDRHVITVRVREELHVLADPLRLEQVLTNLLDNAIKYSPAGGQVDVVVRYAPGAAELSVRDHGTGIPLEKRAHIFDRFYRAHGDDHASGMGLGLYISRQIVELHGGELLVDFPDDGGTRFIMRLPVGPSPGR